MNNYGEGFMPVDTFFKLTSRNKFEPNEMTVKVKAQSIDWELFEEVYGTENISMTNDEHKAYINMLETVCCNTRWLRRVIKNRTKGEKPK